VSRADPGPFDTARVGPVRALMDLVPPAVNFSYPMRFQFPI
jgi:hypothetical protein